MKGIINSIVWIVMLSVSSNCVLAQKIDLTLGSYNVRNENNGDKRKGNGWEQRVPVITSLMRFIDYDIVGCQEVLKDQLEDMNALLPEYSYVGVGRNDGKDKGEFAPIYYKKERFQVLDSGVFWLSKTPEKPSKGWDAALPRICTYVHLVEKATQKKLWFFNLHLDHVGIKAREESSKLVIQRIAEMTNPEEAVALTGDFNVDQHNSIYNILHESGIVQDSYEISPFKYAWNGTFNAFDNNLYTDSRIDHVFVNKNLKVQKYGVLTETYRVSNEESKDVKKGDFPSELSFKDNEARLPSDHFPVVVKVTYD